MISVRTTPLEQVGIIRVFRTVANNPKKLCAILKLPGGLRKQCLLRSEEGGVFRKKYQAFFYVMAVFVA